MTNPTINTNTNKWAICTEFQNTGYISIGPYFFETREKANDALAPFHYRAENRDAEIKSTWLQQEGNAERYYYNEAINKHDDIYHTMARHELSFTAE